MRVAYHVLWKIVGAPNDDAQMKGMTLIPQKSYMLADFNYYREAAHFFKSLPLRVSSQHLCVKTSSEKTGRDFLNDDGVLCFLLKCFPQHSRVRTRLHVGSSMEIQYTLRSHGIPADTFPLDADGIFRKDMMNMWIEKLQQETTNDVARADGPLEEMDMNFNRNEVRVERDDDDDNDDDDSRSSSCQQQREAGIDPLQTDVLFGKGYRLQTHPGNIRFRDIVEQHREEYDGARRRGRKLIAMRLVQDVRNSGVRFLEMSTTGEWVESDQGEVIKKVSQIFREFRKKDHNR